MGIVIYNENEPFVANWLRNLCTAGYIAAGYVDQRSIRDVRPSDVHAATQAHFFAGIGGWSYALRLADWPDDRPVWTGSCPCQPFSAAGSGKGFADERHLWPEWFRLIRVARPPVIFGEQVASPDGLKWLDAVFADLEAENYACAAADLCAAGVGAFHIRQRLYFVAVANAQQAGLYQSSQQLEGRFTSARTGATSSTVGDAHFARSQGRSRTGSGDQGSAGAASVVSGLAYTGREQQCWRESQQRSDSSTETKRIEEAVYNQRCSTVSSFWSAADWIDCRDGKRRPVEPGSFPLAHGVSDRVRRLRGYGNAIVPQLAAAFIRATGLV